MISSSSLTALLLLLPPSHRPSFPNKTAPAQLYRCVDSAPAQLDGYVVAKAPAQIDGCGIYVPSQLDGCVVSKEPAQLDGYVVAKAPTRLDGCVVAKVPTQLDGRAVSKPPTQIDGRAGKEESDARHPDGEMSRRALMAIVAAIRPYRNIAMLLYCAFMFHCVWLDASRAGLDTTGFWHRASLFFGLSIGKRYRLPKNIRVRRMCRAERAVAWRAIMRTASSRLSEKTGLFGGGDGDGRPQAPRAFGRIRPHFREASCILKMVRATTLLFQRAPWSARQTDMEITVSFISYRKF